MRCLDMETQPDPIYPSLLRPYDLSPHSVPDVGRARQNASTDCPHLFTYLTAEDKYISSKYIPALDYGFASCRCLVINLLYPEIL